MFDKIQSIFRTYLLIPPNASDNPSVKRTPNRAWCQYTSPVDLGLCSSCTSLSEKPPKNLLGTQIRYTTARLAWP